MDKNNGQDSHDVNCKVCGLKNLENQKTKFVRDVDADLILCEACIAAMHDAVYDAPKKIQPKEEDFIFETPSTKEIYNFLNEHIISQDDAKKHISIAISQHLKKIKDPSIGKSNLLMVGPTGTGKTEIVRAVAKFLKLPFVSTDATTLTTRGYIGENTESIVGRLLQSCDYNVKRAEKGIIFIDEIDKLAASQNSDSQIGTVAVQQELLKIMEGTIVRIEKPGKGSRNDSVYINTKNILFICAGSFDGLSKLVVKEEKKSAPISLFSNPIPVIEISSTNKNWFDKLETNHLVTYGLIPEFLGRLPIVIQTLPLTKEDLLKIITEPKESIINQYKKLFKIDNIEAEFNQEFLEKIVDESLTKNLGARGVRKVLESKLKDLFFNVDDYAGKKIIINDEVSIVDEPFSDDSSYVKGR